MIQESRSEIESKSVVNEDADDRKRKKKSKRLMNDDEDPAIIELLGAIKEKKEFDEQQLKDTNSVMLPLKRVNSTPMIYQFLPPSNLFPDSRSMDRGIDGLVDIPNQTIYMETITDDVLDKSTLPPKGLQTNLYQSLSFISSADVDKADVKKLKKMKKHETVDFLRIKMGGQPYLDDLYDTIKSPYEDLEAAEKEEEEEAEEEGGSKKTRCYIIIGVVVLLLVAAVGGVLAVVLSGSSEEETAPRAGVLQSEDEASAGGVMFLITGLLKERGGTKVNTDFKDERPPSNLQSEEVEEMFIDVYRYLGFTVMNVRVDIVEPRPSSAAWNVQVGIQAEAKDNLDILMWYGYDKVDVSAENNLFLVEMNKNAKKFFVDRHQAVLESYASFVDPDFVDEAKPLLSGGKTMARRPPAHIPDEWENCRQTCLSNTT